MNGNPDLPHDSFARDWASFRHRYEALERTPVRSATLLSWLTEWSNLEKDIWEQRAGLKRDRYLDTTDPTRETAYQSFHHEVMDPSRAANAVLVARVLAESVSLQDDRYTAIARRWRNETTLAVATKGAVQEEIRAAESAYSAIAWGVPESHGDPEQDWNDGRQYWADHRTEIDRIAMTLLTLRHRQARDAGLPDYQTYRWRELNRLDYTPADAAIHNEAIAAELVPRVNRWVALRQAELGARSLRPWIVDRAMERQPPDWRSVTPVRLAEIVARLLDRLHPEAAAAYAAVRAGYLHIRDDPRQAPITEEFIFPATEQPCVFVTPRGTYEDPALLLHEMGHAIHDRLSLRTHDLFWAIGSDDEFAEMAANAMVVLAQGYLDQPSRYQAEIVRRWFTRYVPRQTVENAFQARVYGQAGAISPAELDEAWDALSQRFIPWEDWDGLSHRRAWGWRESRSFFTSPFYSLNYSAAAIGAVGIWNTVRANGARAVDAYIAALSTGYTTSLPHLCSIAGAPLPFDHEAVAWCARTIEPYVFTHP